MSGSRRRCFSREREKLRRQPAHGVAVKRHEIAPRRNRTVQKTKPAGLRGAPRCLGALDRQFALPQGGFGFRSPQSPLCASEPSRVPTCSSICSRRRRGRPGSVGDLGERAARTAPRLRPAPNAPATAVPPCPKGSPPSRSGPPRRSGAPEAPAGSPRSRETGFRAPPRSGVQRAAGLAQQRAVGRVLDERMLEEISRMRRRARRDKQPRMNEAVQRMSQARLPARPPPQPEQMHAKTPGRSPRRFARRPWPLPSRSSRAISEACRLAGTASAGDGMLPRPRAPCAFALRLQHRLRHLLDEQAVSPSARSTMSCRMFAGRAPCRRRLCRSRPRRRAGAQPIDGERVTCGRPTQGAANSGRNVTNSKTRRPSILSTSRPTTSRLEGSAQWASSKIISVGVWRDMVSIWAINASRVFLPALLRSEVQRRIAAVVRQRQHLGQKRGILARRRALGQQRIELVELGLARRPRAQARPRAPFAQMIG